MIDGVVLLLNHSINGNYRSAESNHFLPKLHTPPYRASYCLLQSISPLFSPRILKTLLNNDSSMANECETKQTNNSFPVIPRRAFEPGNHFRLQFNPT